MNYYDLKILILTWSQARVDVKFSNFWLNIVFEWQTLIAAIVAGVPAAIGAYLLWKQIRIQQKEMVRIKEKEETSARIRLASSLASLTKHYKICIGPILDGKYCDHIVPTSSLETLMAAAPIVNSKIFEHIQKLILDFQIFSSRFPAQTGVLSRDLQNHALQVLAKLHQATNDLYPYARFKSETVPVAPFTDKTMFESLTALAAVTDRKGHYGADEATIKRAVASAFPPRTTREVPLDAD